MEVLTELRQPLIFRTRITTCCCSRLAGQIGLAEFMTMVEELHMDAMEKFYTAGCAPATRDGRRE